MGWQGFIQDFSFGGEKEGREGGETNPYVNKYATAHLPRGRECPTPPLNEALSLHMLRKHASSYQIAHTIISTPALLKLMVSYS